MASETLDIKVTDNGSSKVVQRDIAAIGSEAAHASYTIRNMDHLLSVLGAGFVVDRFASMADEWQNIHNKLLNVASSTENLNAVNQALYEGAQKSRTAYGEFVNVYQELAIQANRFGTSQKQMVDMTTTMMEAAQLAHPSLAAMKAGVEQLILSMERGRLQTRGFSALLKDTPQLAQAIADGMGLSINKLRELAHHSQVTAKELVDALGKAGPEVAEKFLKLNPTIEGAMLVLHNGWVKFIGDLDASTGIIGGVTSLIIGMSNHMDVLAGALVVFGALATAIFGNIARKAILSMWAALVASGPVGWAITAITALVGLIAIFGDKITVTSDGMVTLMDYIKGTFDVLVGLFSMLGEWLGGIWAKIGPGVKKALDEVVSWWLWLQNLGWQIFKGIVNFIIGTFVFGYHAIVDTWNMLPAAIQDAFVTAFNWIGDKFGTLVNTIIGGINKISSFAHMGTIDPVKITHMQNGHAGAADAYAHQMNADRKSAYGEDYVGDAVTGVSHAAAFVGQVLDTAARHRSMLRRNATGTGGIGTGHTAGEDDPSDAKKKHSHGKSRAELIAEETRKYQDETANANNLSVTPLNEAAFKEVTRFDEQLKKTKDAHGKYMPGLSPEEKASMMALVQGYEDANRLQKERFAILNETLMPQQKYQDGIKAITQLEGAHMITAEQAAKAERDVALAYLDKQTDAASGAMRGQLEILKEMNDQAKPLADAMKSIWDKSSKDIKDYQTNLQAVNELLKDNLITADKARDAIRDSQLAYLKKQKDAQSGATYALLKIQQAAEDAAGAMANTIDDAFKGMEDAFTKFMSGQKVDVGGLITTLRADLAKQMIQPVEGALAGFLQSKFGVKLPGLEAKIGTTAANPMWVKNVDQLAGGPGGLTSGISGLDSMFNFSGLGSLSGTDFSKTGLLGGTSNIIAQLENTPLMGDVTSWTSFSQNLTTDFTQSLNTSFKFGSEQMNQAIGAGIAMLGPMLGQMFGMKSDSVGGALLDIVTTVAGAYVSKFGFTTKGFATGGDFTVGGAGGVDSQLVQFKATPGERVSIDRNGGGPVGGKGGDVYYIDVDARGSSDLSIEQRIHQAMAKALPAAQKQTRAAAMTDISKTLNRQQLPGGK